MSIDRLRAHYGFTRMPFGKDLAPGMLHAHDAHAQAVARISWCIGEQAIGVVTGECGAGKTVAARAAVAGLDASRHTVLYLGTPGVGLRGIYGMIVTALGGIPRFHHAALIPQAQDLLAAESSERGKQVVLIIDEAHLLDAESLEGVRCLSNIGMDQTAPFCLVLLGQPTLRRRLRQGAFTALDQRIAVRYAIAGLSAKETQSYVQHHLALAGRSDTLFSDDALALIHEISRGLARSTTSPSRR
jgi:type II secretory pathway predicted ATPase ExeA